MFPIRANPGGLLARRGHSEATIELMARAGRKPAGVLSEITNPDGTMARLPELLPLAGQLDLPIVSIADLAADCLQSAA
jgi:3,4-dihydroxy 2-butanone 4-phosphate synthase